MIVFWFMSHVKMFQCYIVHSRKANVVLDSWLSWYGVDKQYFQIHFCIPQKKVIQVWNDMKVSKWEQGFHFWAKRIRESIKWYSSQLVKLVVVVNNASMVLLPLGLLAVLAAIQEKSLSTPFHEYTGCNLTVADMRSRLTLHHALSIKTKGPIREGSSFSVSRSFSYSLLRAA